MDTCPACGYKLSRGSDLAAQAAKAWDWWCEVVASGVGAPRAIVEVYAGELRRALTAYHEDRDGVFTDLASKVLVERMKKYHPRVQLFCIEKFVDRHRSKPEVYLLGMMKNSFRLTPAELDAEIAAHRRQCPHGVRAMALEAVKA